jgi:hypothetical protein
VIVRERRKSRERQNQNSPRVRKRRREERREDRTEFDFGGNEVSADRGFASTTQHITRGECTVSMSANKKFPE